MATTSRFRLLAGQHIQADRSRPVLGPDGRPVSPPRFERQTFTADDRAGKYPVVESETDLVERFGPQKFERLSGGSEAEAQGSRRVAELEAELARLRAELLEARTPGDPTPQNLERSPAIAPTGQVSTGFQGGKPEPKQEPPKQQAFADALDAMSDAELRKLAEEEEIDLDGVKDRAGLVKTVRESRGEQGRPKQPRAAAKPAAPKPAAKKDAGEK